VRKLSAEKLYTGLLTMEDYSKVIPAGDEDVYDAVMDVLSETEWVGPQKQLVSTVKKQIYDLFNLTPKAPAVKSVETADSVIDTTK